MLPPSPGQTRTDPVTAIPVSAAGIHLRQNPLCSRPIRAIDCSGQTVIGVVHEADRFFVITHFLNSDDRPEAFFPHHCHSMVHPDEHGWLEIVTTAVAAFPPE